MFKFVVVFNSAGKVWDPFSHAQRGKVVAITCQTCCILVCGSLSAVSHLILRQHCTPLVVALQMPTGSVRPDKTFAKVCC